MLQSPLGDVIKGSLRHGEWLPWLRANCSFSHDRATEYMHAYKGAKLRETRNLSAGEGAATSITVLAKRAKSQRKPGTVGWTEAVEHHLGAMPEGHSRNTPLHLRWMRDQP